MPSQIAYQAIQATRSYIDGAYPLPINLDLLAERAGFSKYHFIRLFQEIYGITPHQYVIEKRLQAARSLLCSSELSVTEICFEVGFQSLGSFSSLFQRQVGYSPRLYRQKVWTGVTFVRFVPRCFMRMYGFSR